MVVRGFFSFLHATLHAVTSAWRSMGACKKKVVWVQVEKRQIVAQKFQLEDIACKSEFHFLRRVWYTFLVESSCSQTCTHPVALETTIIIGRDHDDRPLPPSDTLGNSQSLPPFTSLMTRRPMMACVAPFPLTLVALFLLLYCCHLTLTN